MMTNLTMVVNWIETPTIEQWAWLDELRLKLRNQHKREHARSCLSNWRILVNYGWPQFFFLTMYSIYSCIVCTSFVELCRVCKCRTMFSLRPMNTRTTPVKYEIRWADGRFQTTDTSERLSPRAVDGLSLFAAKKVTNCRLKSQCP